MVKVALVTGATGFVGKHLCKRLLQSGWSVHIICRPSSNVFALFEFLKAKVEVHYYHGVDDDSIIEMMNKVKPQVVFHLASLFLAQHRFSDIMPLIQSNIIFSTQLIEAMMQNKIYNLVNTGTSWQHYHNDKYNPVCLYAATKQAFQDILKYYEEAKGLRVITLKLFDTYGPADRRPKILNLFEKIAKSKEALEMSFGEQYVDFVYIDDVIDAFLLAAQYVQSGNFLGEYAVATEQPIQLRKLAEIFEKVNHKVLNIQWGRRPYREREVMRPWNQGKTLPGWQAKTNLEDGISKSYDYSNFKK